MKRQVLLFIALTLGLGACSASIAPKVNNAPATNEEQIDFDNLPENEYVPSASSMEPLGTFNLDPNSNTGTLGALDTFRWEECENADKYSLEFCSNSDFLIILAMALIQEGTLSGFRRCPMNHAF